MQIVKLQCPACGATITAPRDGQEFFCSYCQTRLAMTQHDGSTSLIEAKPEQPTQTPVSLPPMNEIAAANAPVSNGRGCIAALIMWLVIGPLVVFLIMLPFAILAPTGPDGHVLLPDWLASCLGLTWIGVPVVLAIYAFFYFRTRTNPILGYVTQPFRWIRHRNVQAD